MPFAQTARTVRPCRHLFTDGRQCGSPALRGEELCFYHHSTQRPLKTQALHGRSTRAVLPEPLDLHAIQRGLAELLRLTAAELLPLPLAAQLHRQLASASENLARIDRAEARAQARAQALHLDRAPVTDYTNHPTLGTIAPAAQPADVETQVETQPEQNEDFETSKKISDEPSNPAQKRRVPHLRDSLTVAKVGFHRDLRPQGPAQRRTPPKPPSPTPSPASPFPPNPNSPNPKPNTTPPTKPTPAPTTPSPRASTTALRPAPNSTTPSSPSIPSPANKTRKTSNTTATCASSSKTSNNKKPQPENTNPRSTHHTSG